MKRYVANNIVEPLNNKIQKKRIFSSSNIEIGIVSSAYDLQPHTRQIIRNMKTSARDGVFSVVCNTIAHILLLIYEMIIDVAQTFW